MVHRGDDSSWCHKKKCTKSSDEKLLSYSKKEKIDDGWSEHSLSPNCMSLLDNKEDSTGNIKTTVTFCLFG